MKEIGFGVDSRDFDNESDDVVFTFRAVSTDEYPNYDGEDAVPNPARD